MINIIGIKNGDDQILGKLLINQGKERQNSMEINKKIKRDPENK